MDADLARGVVLELKRALADALAGRAVLGDGTPGGLVAGLDPRARRKAGLALEVAEGRPGPGPHLAGFAAPGPGLARPRG